MRQLIYLVAIFFLVATASAASWTPRIGHSVVAIPDGKIVLFGGETYIAGPYLNDTWSTSDNGTTWSLINASSGWEKRYGQCAVAIPSNNNIFMFGGTNDITRYDEFWNSTDDGATWSEMVQTISGYPNGRSFSACTVSSGSVIIIGGGHDYAAPTNDTFISTTSGTTWTNKGDGPWLDRYGHTLVTLSDSSIVLMGGYDSTGAYRNDVWKSNDFGTTWVRLTTAAGWSPRAFHTTVALSDDTILLMGGRDATTIYHDVWKSTDNGVTWTLVTNNPGWMARSGFPSVVTADDSILIFGGYGGANAMNDTWRSTDGGLNWQYRAGSGSTGFVPQDIWMVPQYLQIFNIVDKDTGLPIPLATIETIGGTQVATATRGTGTMPLDFGSNTVIFRSSGYIAESVTYLVDGEGTHTVQMTATASISQNTWWTPHTVQVTVFDANYGTRLYDVNIQARYNETSMPTGWINTLYGINSAAQADMINRTLIMNGTTGSAGTVTFTMLGSIKYDFTLNAAQYGISNYKVMEWPSDNMLNIYILTTGSLLPTQRNSTYTNLNGTRLYFTEPDINNVSMCIDYIDTSGETSSVTFIWKFTNGTTLNTSTVNPGTGLNTICNVTRNIRGTQVVWGYNATRNPVTV